MYVCQHIDLKSQVSQINNAEISIQYGVSSYSFRISVYFIIYVFCFISYLYQPCKQYYLTVDVMNCLATTSKLRSFLRLRGNQLFGQIVDDVD